MDMVFNKRPSHGRDLEWRPKQNEADSFAVTRAGEGQLQKQRQASAGCTEEHQGCMPGCCG